MHMAEFPGFSTVTPDGNGTGASAVAAAPWTARSPATDRDPSVQIRESESEQDLRAVRRALDVGSIQGADDAGEGFEFFHDCSQLSDVGASHARESI